MKSKLKQWRTKRALLSQAELATLIGCSQQMIAAIENNLKRPSPELAARISAATNGEVTIMDLLFPGGVPNLPPAKPSAAEARQPETG